MYLSNIFFKVIIYLIKYILFLIMLLNFVFWGLVALQ